MFIEIFYFYLCSFFTAAHLSEIWDILEQLKLLLSISNSTSISGRVYQSHIIKIYNLTQK